jgi:hypothetical protein
LFDDGDELCVQLNETSKGKYWEEVSSSEVKKERIRFDRLVRKLNPDALDKLQRDLDAINHPRKRFVAQGNKEEILPSHQLISSLTTGNKTTTVSSRKNTTKKKKHNNDNNNITNHHSSSTTTTNHVHMEEDLLPVVPSPDPSSLSSVLSSCPPVESSAESLRCGDSRGSVIITNSGPVVAPTDKKRKGGVNIR